MDTTRTASRDWKQPVFAAVSGMALFFTISLINAHFDLNRELHSYLPPLLLGMASGGAVGLLLVNVRRKERKVHDTLVSLIGALAHALDERDSYTHGHSRRVASLAGRIGRRLGLSVEELRQLHLAGILHDVGKIGVPDAILLKPDRLTPEEFAVIARHPEITAAILSHIDDPAIARIAEAGRRHHERFDGRGYPGGLAGRDIPLAARILAVADSFDAMTSHRSYRRNLDKDEALLEIERCAGTQFDPEAAGAFVALMREEGGQGDCPHASSCPVFARIERAELSESYKARYCHALFEDCARFSFRDQGVAPPVDLLPDGGKIRELEKG